MSCDWTWTTSLWMLSNLHLLYCTKDMRQVEQTKSFHGLLQFLTLVHCHLGSQATFHQPWLVGQATFHQLWQMNETRWYDYNNIVWFAMHECVAVYLSSNGIHHSPIPFPPPQCLCGVVPIAFVQFNVWWCSQLVQSSLIGFDQFRSLIDFCVLFDCRPAQFA